MVAKDNHVPCIEEPVDQSMFLPTNGGGDMNKLEDWKISNKDNKLYTPGYPYNSLYNGVSCKT
jgi:hypothetical protein